MQHSLRISPLHHQPLWASTICASLLASSLIMVPAWAQLGTRSSSTVPQSTPPASQSALPTSGAVATPASSSGAFSTPTPINTSFNESSNSRSARSSIAGQATLTPVTLPETLYAPLLKTSVLTVDLPSVLARVEAENLFIRQQESQVDVARADLALQLIDPLPSVNLAYSYTKFDGVIQIFGNQTLPVEQTVHEPRINGAATIGLGGRQIWNMLRAHRDLRAAKALLSGTLQQQLASASRDYYTWQEAHLVKNATDVSLAAANEQLRRAEARFRAGVGTKLEVMQAQSQQALRLQEQFTALKQVAEAEELLLNRLNLPVSYRLQPTTLDTSPHTLVSTPMVAGEAWLASVLENHPEVKRLKAQEAALRWQSRSVLSSLLPDVNVTAYTGKRGPELNQLQRITGFGLSMQTTLGNKLGLELPSQYIGARKLTEAKQTETELTVRNLQTQVMQALLESQRAERSITAAQSREEASTEAYRLATARGDVGVGTYLDTLTASEESSLSRAGVANALMDYNRAQVTLVEALGAVTPEALLYGVSVSEEGELQPRQHSTLAEPVLSLTPAQPSQKVSSPQQPAKPAITQQQQTKVQTIEVITP